MNSRPTTDRAEVQAAYRWSLSQAAARSLEQEDDWDRQSSWHNVRFVEKSTGRAWVIYMADHAWPAEVRVAALVARTGGGPIPQ